MWLTQTVLKLGRFPKCRIRNKRLGLPDIQCVWDFSMILPPLFEKKASKTLRVPTAVETHCILQCSLSINNCWMRILLAYEHAQYLEFDLSMLQAVKSNCNHNHQLACDSNTAIAPLMDCFEYFIVYIFVLKMVSYLNSASCKALDNILNTCLSKSVNNSYIYPLLNHSIYDSICNEEWSELMRYLREFSDWS